MRERAPALALLPENQLVLACARFAIASGDAAGVRSAAQEVRDWASVRDTAMKRGAAGFVYTALAQGSPCDASRGEMRALQAEYRRRAAHHLRLSEELLRLLDALEQGGLQALAYKGPALAVWLYDKSGLRASSDIDLLIPPAGARAAAEIACTLGYRRIFHQDGGLAFAMEDAPVWAELHTAIMPHFFPLDMPFDTIWARRHEVSLLGRPVATPPAADMLLMLAAHGAQHGWERVDWIADIAAIISRSPDLNWNEAILRARALDAERMLGTALWLAHTLLACRLPEQAAHEVHVDRRATELAGQAAGFLFSPAARPISEGDPRIHLFRLQCRRRLRHKLVYMAHCCRIYAVVAFEPTSNDVRWLRLPRRLWFLYRVVRPVRLALKVARARVGALAVKAKAGSTDPAGDTSV